MADDLFVGRDLRLLPTMAASILSALSATAISDTFYPGHWKYIFSSLLIITIGLWQIWPLISYNSIKICTLLILILFTIFLITPLTSDENLKFVAIPMAIGQYAPFIFGNSFFLNKFRH